MIERADYVIVGAGSAGCVVASRLTETDATVVLLEAGPKDRNPMIHIPAGLRSLQHHPVLNWNYTTEPEESTGGRRVYWPRGKVLGGSSSINGMLYVRGNPQDYNTWAQLGCRGWSFDDVLPYFKQSEDFRGEGEDEFRSKGGLLAVEPYRTILPLTHKFVEAAQQAGYAFNEDYNGRKQEGVAYSQNTRDHRFRASTAQTFLKAAKGRKNLEVITKAYVTKLIFEGRRCVGVAYRVGNEDMEVRANKEVICSGGAINSPQILQLSGIGPAAHLQKLGVDVVHDSPGVGANLNDHFVVRLVHNVKGTMTLNQIADGIRVIPEVLKYALWGNGALTFGATSAMVFCNSREGLASPDLQLLFVPASSSNKVVGKLSKDPGMSLSVCPVRPQSRGTVMAESPDPMEKAVIRANYFGGESDVQVMLSGIKQAQKIFSQPALQEFSTGETVPGKAIETAADCVELAKARGVTIYHPVGTCKMGTDTMAVTDPQLKVIGVEGLRVIDASIMPGVTSGNTNAPTIMIGEKGAAMILEDNRG
ncbi:MAG: GMC family oxidoreductase N-terminal domain-containing protein [Proteobacteria bacterium]|nr:GMC family oxidoreductase N-terminal domain-containing protein [Pseudomonadota bacterium]